MSKSKVEQYETKDGTGKRGETIIKYRTFEQSDEIRPDRMSPDPIIGYVFETLQEKEVVQIDQNTFQILGTGKIVTKV